MASKFAIQVERWVQRTGLDVKLMIKLIAFKIHDRIVERTPVGNPDLWQSPAPPGYTGGRARASWTIIEGTAADLNVAPEKGPYSVSLGADKKSGLPPSTSYVISNNLPYIARLEHGWSKQAPVGMVALAIADVRTELEVELG